jgi:hypothetical protein
MQDDNLALVLAIWILALLPLASSRRGNGVAGSGLVWAYVLSLWMLFWTASALYLLPWYQGSLRDFTLAGTEESLYGILGFVFGSVVLAPQFLNRRSPERQIRLHDSDALLPLAYMVTGVVCYGLLSVFIGRVLSLTSILSAGEELVVVGLSLCCWKAWREGGMRKALPWLAMALMMPVITIVTRGFIGYGTVAAISVLIFFSNFVRSKPRMIAAGILLGYVALSVYVTYMRDRDQIRHTVWTGQAFSDRMDRISEAAASFEWFDPQNQAHLKRMDSRLNQSYLTGAAVEHMKTAQNFAHGETLWDAVLALIPRIVWPEKRITAGSGDLVSRFTGFTFDKYTSVGIGQVMEFYANFGTPGVVIGFMIFGVILTVLDVLATERLANGDLHGFVLLYLPGLSFLQVGGQLTEITASAAAAVVVALVVNRILDRFQTKGTSEPHVPLVAPFEQNA